jgi:hypothetical protein
MRSRGLAIVAASGGTRDDSLGVGLWHSSPPGVGGDGLPSAGEIGRRERGIGTRRYSTGADENCVRGGETAAIVELEEQNKKHHRRSTRERESEREQQQQHQVTGSMDRW